MCVLSINVPIRKKSRNLFNDPRIYIYIYIYSSSSQICVMNYIFSHKKVFIAYTECNEGL